MLLTDDDEMQPLNRHYRGSDSTTDVLSFPMLEGEGASLHPGLLGDIVISVEQAQRQAPDGQLEPELLRLLVHGLCHLVGFDHGTASETKQMRVLEDRLLQILGVDGVVISERT